MHVGHPRGGDRKEARRNIAAELAAERAKRTDEEQLALIKTRRGHSLKETERLLKRIERSKKKTAPAKGPGNYPGREIAVKQSRE